MHSFLVKLSILLLCWFSLQSHAINLKVDRVTINSSLSSVDWTQVTFQQPFSTVPVVVTMPTNANSEPASVRIRNVTVTGFEVGVVEPQGEDANTAAMSIDFFAAEVGSYNLPGNVRMFVDTHTTTTNIGRFAPGANLQGDLIFFPSGTFSQPPAIIAQVQTINSQPALTNGVLSSPWLETTIQSVSSSIFRLALERAETSNGTVVNETIGYIAFEDGGESTLGGQVIQGVLTPNNILGWDNGCYNNNFPSAFATAPIVIASQNSRDGSDGGWLRRCQLTSSAVGLQVDEDQAADSDRAHTSEEAGVLAIANSFNDFFSGARFEAGRANITSSNASVAWTQVSFSEPFSTTPLLFSLPTNEGVTPASLRFRNISINGFDIAAFEPPGGFASHPEMTVDYIAIEPGIYALTNGDTFEAGSLDSSAFQSGILGGSSWDNISFTTPFTSSPAVIFQVQSNNNESTLDPSFASAPWLTVAVSNLSSASVDVALERAEVSTGSLSSPETIAYFAVNNLANNNLTLDNSDVIEYEMFLTASNILGVDNGCYSNSFVDAYATPHAVASQMTRNGSNGGWVKRCDLQSTTIGLQIDEDQENDSERTHIAEQASVFVFSQAFDAEINQVNNFVILHDTAGINCLREAITIRAVDNSGIDVPDYVESISLSTSTNRGSWFIVDSSGTSSTPAQGTLVDAVSNDGTATYTFDPADNGRVLLFYENTQAESININVTENSIIDDDSEGLITFRPFGFTVSPDPITSQIAGRSFMLTLTAAGQTPSQPSCGVIEEYTGVKAINFWSNYQNPIIGSEPVVINGSSIASSEILSSAQSVNFSSGEATINLQYDDVGLIGVFAKDESGIGEPPSGSGDEIIGGVSPFVVKPFAWDIQISGNPNATTASDAVFGVAGNNFDTTLRSVLWQSADDIDNNGIADTSANLNDNGITPNIVHVAGVIGLTPTAQVVTNSNGILLDTAVNFSSFGVMGSANEGEVSISQSWSEAGILTINANHTNFLGSSETVSGRRENIGRFTPDHFELLFVGADDFQPLCGGFSYGGFANGTSSLDKNGQSDDIQFIVEAENSTNAVTQNYSGVFAKLESGTITSVPFNLTSGIGATGTLQYNVLPFLFANGTANISLTNVNYQFDNTLAPFNLRLDNTAIDADGVTGNLSSSAVLIRLGRLRLSNAYGSELDSLEIPLQTEYFDGTAWRLNSLDSCTSYISTDLQFLAGSYRLNLSPGETLVTAPSPISENLISGQPILGNGFLLSPPGDNNFGEVTLFFNLSNFDWLTFDWNSDASVDDPQATASFGYYRGSDRVIYWREM